MLDLLDDEFPVFPRMMLLNTDMFNNDKELRELHQQRRQMMGELDEKIRRRRQSLWQEHEANNPARYSRKYSSSYSNINGKEKTETKDTVEENEDGAKTIQEKADTVEKDNGKVVDEEHVDVKLSQDKQDKNKWTVVQDGKTTVLNATDSDFGSKLQALMESKSKSSKTDKTKQSGEDSDEPLPPSSESSKTEKATTTTVKRTSTKAKPSQKKKETTTTPPASKNPTRKQKRKSSRQSQQKKKKKRPSK